MGFDECSELSMTAQYDINISDFLSVCGNFSEDEFRQVSEEYQRMTHWLSHVKETVVITLFSILSVLGLIGNSVVFYVIAKKGGNQSSRNWYILNLACSDIFTCAICNPLTVVRLVLKNWELGTFLCKMVPSLQTVYVFVSTFTIVALAIDRYSSIIYNNHQVHFKRWALSCIVFIWMASIVLSIPLIIVHDIEHVKGFNGNVIFSICMENWNSKDDVIVYSVILLVIQYLSPLTAIIFLHFLIGRYLKSRFRLASPECSNVRRKRRRHRKNIILLSCMAISFGAAWLPIHLINNIASTHHELFIGIDFPMINAMSMIVAFSSVCLNPIIYGMLNSNFRRDLLKMCGQDQSRRVSVYTDLTRRSSPNHEQMVLITTTPVDVGISNLTLNRIRNGSSDARCISAL